ncbi:S-adenosyl-L-methionine-dependent methyltransferase [Daedaleopsis nitida]|nr:S-adenosyl-L-methionine-dependent methyltransferase [Daedaleopsis nitida]
MFCARVKPTAFRASHLFFDSPSGLVSNREPENRIKVNAESSPFLVLPLYQLKMSPCSEIDLSQLRQLTDLISASVSELERQAASTSAVQPGGRGNAGETRTPLLTIASAAGQLSALVKPPNVFVAEVATAGSLTNALRVVVDASVPEIIRALSGPDAEAGVSVNGIAELCGVESSRLSRILRLLATHHIFRECTPLPSSSYDDRFANTPTSAALDSGAPLEEILAPPGLKRWSQRGVPQDDQEKREKLRTYQESMREWEAEDEESIRRRWARKFGRANEGAALAALTSLTSGQANIHLTAVRDALLPTVFPGSRARTHALQAIRHRPMDDPLRAPFNFFRAHVGAAGEQGPDPANMTIYAWQSLPQHTQLLHRFGCGMKAMGDFTPEDAIVRGFEWSALPAESTVLDVGGGVGSASLQILRANPRLKLVVQDLPEFISVAPKYWETRYPEAIEAARVTFQVHDFFQPQRALPAGAAPSAILMRMIMHNWPDAECETILGHARALAGPDTRLIIVDSILTRACPEATASADITGKTNSNRDAHGEGGSKAHGEAPEPLLANWGTANGLAYKLDMIMLAHHNASERTFSAFETLLRKSGWRIDALHSASESWMPQIVAVPI